MTATTPTTDPAAVDPFAPARLGPLTLRNRFVKAATFEGMSPDHVVTDELVELHRTTAAGGVALTTLAYCAVSEEGCGTPNEIVLTPEARPGLARLADAVHAEGALVSAQIGHAGAVAAGTGRQGVSPSPVFSPLALRRTRAATAGDILRITDEFAAAARVVVDAGFDAIELHLGHGYLLSEFLSPKLNRRTDAWGGDLEARARFPRDVCRVVREAIGPDVALTAKLNLLDGVRGGFGVDESVEVCRLLEADGALDAIELTGGSSLQNPMLLFRGDAPIAELSAAMRQPMRSGMKLIGGRFLRSYPYEEAYFLPQARRVRAAVDLPLVLLGGISRLATVHAAMAEGFEFVAMGRALLMEPDLIARWRDGATDDSTCTHCNRCMATIYTGTRCVLVEA
jgi:2,4-dienoyl-CoA reductase-like NADH-dependent reductase (Old Yellow Enzyme family)